MCVCVCVYDEGCLPLGSPDCLVVFCTARQSVCVYVCVYVCVCVCVYVCVYIIYNNDIHESRDHAAGVHGFIRHT